MNLNNIYGDPYNIDGVIHPGVHSSQLRQGLTRHGYSDLSDNERQMRGTKYSRNSDDEDMMNMEGPKFGKGHHSRGHGSQNDLLSVPGGKKGAAAKRSSNKKANRSFNEIDAVASGEEEDQDDFIVGPNSNLSKIKQRQLRGSRGRVSDDEDDQYLLLQRER